MQFFILAEGQKIEFLALSGRESSLVQTFCESCAHLDITHPSVYITQRFVIQSCPTLTGGFLHVHNYGTERETCAIQTIWLCMLHSNFLFHYLHVLLLVRCLCVVAVLFQGSLGAHHHCESLY